MAIQPWHGSGIESLFDNELVSTLQPRFERLERLAIRVPGLRAEEGAHALEMSR
ncbi:MAG TPA: hypothetical protein VLK65_09610 [Vicinamibacteria bacterium]|nr:hypothetical protein [Vicinamibacteria bacterium]